MTRSCQRRGGGKESNEASAAARRRNKQEVNRFKLSNINDRKREKSEKGGRCKRTEECVKKKNNVFFQAVT